MIHHSMIKSLKLKFGHDYEQIGNLSFNLSPITIFVGPNNSGKSLVLEEIFRKINE